ncbi:protein translocase subunit SecF [Sandaracinobacteroides saxicola]|uniref:Protein-export membrane protein SecF n=1 Tax=Sandaracinobacteroides saxicola TaxID=2759707 RepID=A0A7G5IID3_9SPHN|nr:protein translocase subunit SecF [Sandaracinobacteroides saxicola]QMW23125.1 protein translocase subunit SecF [Sandaracinobacteroides saxicola]
MRLLKLVPDNTNIKFLRWRWVALAFTMALVVASIVLLAVRGLNFGVDFAGGLMMEVRFEKPVALDELRTTVNRLDVGEVSLQTFGNANTISIRLPLPPGDEEAVQRVVAKVQAALKVNHPDAETRRVETVSGKVSGELLRDGAWAMALAMLAVAIYIWFRFEWQFGVGALFSLFHDVTITLGFFALTQLEFNLNIVAAVLTIIGYSLNDTIVVYDRIRENLRKYRKMEIEPLLDLSVNETLSRTIVTSLSMLIALGTLVVLGGDVIFGFSIAMFLGILIGTYSSIYVAAPLLIWLGVGPHSFLPKENELTAKAERVAPKA